MVYLLQVCSYAICICLMRFVRSVMRYTLSQGRTRPKSFGCSVRVHKRAVVDEMTKACVRYGGMLV